MGDFAVEGDHVLIHRDSAACDGAPDGLAVDRDRLLFGERRYFRADPAMTWVYIAPPPDAL
jgi:hypothetical protein